MREILLFNVSGQDMPGVTSSITALMSGYDVHILDIGQAVIHDHLNLGILAELPEQRGSDILKDILFKVHELGLQIKFTPVSNQSYMDWTAEQGKARHIVTLLARKISAQHIAKVTEVVARYGLNIDRVDRLSGRVPIGAIESLENTKACVEFSVRGPLQDAEVFRRDFLELANELDVDIAYQEDTPFRKHRRLIAFDMDSTLIEAEVIDELAKAAGVGEQVAEITEAAMRGEIDFTESFKQRVALLKGLDESVLAGIAQNLKITEGAPELIAEVKKLGYRTAILSGGFTYFGEYLQKKLGIDYVYANTLDIVDGKCTGEVSGIVVDGQRKAALLRELAEKEQINLEQVIAVGDGANDLPMLSIAGLGIAFRAKPIVKRSAQHAISNLGLDSILYLIGLRERDLS